MSLMTSDCPIGSHTEARPCLDNSMAAVGGFDMSYKVVRYDHCGFHYAQQLPDADTFSAYYQYVSNYDAQDSVAPVDRVRIDVTERFLEPRIGKSERVADLGCGYGTLLGGLHVASCQPLQILDLADERMGRSTMRASSSIQESPEVAVLVSLFPSREDSAAHLRKTMLNPIVLHYHLAWQP